MLPDHVTMDMLRINAQLSSKQSPESGCIQGCAGADHTCGGDAMSCGCMRRQMGHDVDRISCNQQDCFWCIGKHLWNDGIKNSGVSSEQFQAAFTRSLTHAGCKDHNLAT